MQKPKRIVVVGGGTAGWMTACLLNRVWGGVDSSTKVTLVESCDVATVGVGEGSTPYMRQFFQQLDIPESEWMPACNATYKCGISFPGWSGKDGFESYFHPFFSALDLAPATDFFSSCNKRRRGKSVACHPDDYFVAAELARRRYSPIKASDLQSPHDYAYHFDAGLLASFLKEHAKARGVIHCIDHVESVQQNDAGELCSLRLKSHGIIQGDFFFDCSGFASLLIGKTLQQPFLSYADTLFNDSAVALPTPLEPEPLLPSETVSKAASNGWMWKIPLTHRYGNGYVYSSRYLSAQQAEEELRTALGLAVEGVEAKHLQMRIGRVEQHWVKNCVAAGLSQGFIEPLEATAIGLIQYTIEQFIEHYQRGDFSDRYRQDFNRLVNKSFDGVKDYVSLHYRLNARTDTQYWIDNRESATISGSLERIIDCWDSGGDFDACLTAEKSAQSYQRPSWYCLFSGMGRFASHVQGAAKFTRSAVEARYLCQQLAQQFYPHQLQWLGERVVMEDNSVT